MNYRTFSLCGVIAVTMGLPSSVLGQTRGMGSSSGRSTTPPPATAQPGSMIMVSGNVINQDGSPLPAPVTIERVCNGRVSRAGRSDFRGYFTVSLARNPSAWLADPESTAEMGGGGTSAMDYLKARLPRSTSAANDTVWGCELRASLAGFRSSSVRIPSEEVSGGASLGTINVGTIVLERTDQAQGSTVSATSLKAPKDAKKAYERGHHAVENNKLQEAQQELEKAVQLYPQYAAAWLDVGWVYAQQNQLDKARNAFQQAQTADQMFVPAYVALSSIAVRESKWQEAAEQSARATQLDGVDFPVAFYYNSLANYRLGNLEQAEKSARRVETLGAQHAFPQVSLLLGVVLANRQNYPDAAEEFRSYLKAAPTAANADKVRQQLAEMEKLGAGETKAEAAPPAK